MIEKPVAGTVPGNITEPEGENRPVEFPVFYKDAENPNLKAALTLYAQFGVSGEIAATFRAAAARAGMSVDQFWQDFVAKKILRPAITEALRTFEQIEAADRQGGGGSHI